MTIVPATREHIDSFFPVKLEHTCVAFTAFEGDRIIAIAGYFNESHRRVLFSHITDDARQYPVALYKTGLKLIKMATKSRIPLQATADNNVEASERFLERLGFVKVSSEVWQWA
jgi:hypothetical protein